jgi:hypothetical protein
VTTRVKYSGSTPGADSNTYVIFDSTVAFPGANFVQGAGLSRISIRFDHIYTGTVNMYRSVNRGSTWTQVMQQSQSAPDTTQSSYFDVSVEAFADFKVEWVNGGTAQNPWSVDIALTAERDPVFTFEGEIAALGAIAHFDPSWGASDDGTTSTWVDRIAGNTVTSATQASRLVYSGSLASLNNRPGWSGTSVANSHLRNTGSTALGLAMAGVLPHTIYSVRRATLTTVAIYMSSSKSGSSDYWYVGNLNSVNNSAYVRNQAGQTNNTGIIRHATEASVAVATFTGTTVAIHDNGGVALAPAANTKNIDTNNLCIGGLIINTAVSFAFDGDIGDIIVFPTAHTDAERRYVEQLIAAKYGWPCIQGLSGFSAANYLSNAGLTSGIRGDNTNGMWNEALIRPDAVPSGTQYIEMAWLTLSGQAIYSSGAGLSPFALNGTVLVAGPVRTIAATDVGKLMLVGGTAGPSNLVRTFINAAEVGAGSALTGYTKTSGIAFAVGARAAASPASSYSIFGIAGGDVEQVAADHAARAAAIKAAGSFVATGGATPTHAWSLIDGRSSFSDLIGSDALTLAGTLTRAQIIVTSWPW